MAFIWIPLITVIVIALARPVASQSFFACTNTDYSKWLECGENQVIQIDSVDIHDVNSCGNFVTICSSSLGTRCHGRQTCLATVQNQGQWVETGCKTGNFIYVQYSCYTYYTVDNNQLTLCHKSYFQDVSVNINCSESNTLIDIRSATLHTVNSLEPCGSSDSSTCDFETTMPSCHGKRSCTISSELSDQDISCDGQSHRSNLLQVEYRCQAFRDGNTLFLPEQELTAPRWINIVSPRFPCQVPTVVSSIHCAIKPNSRRNLYGVHFFYELLKLDYNKENILLLRNQEAVWDSSTYNIPGAVNHVEVYASETLNQNDVIHIMYTKTGENPGGTFWINFMGYLPANGEQIDMAVSCSTTFTSTTNSQDNTCVPFREFEVPKVSSTIEPSSSSPVYDPDVQETPNQVQDEDQEESGSTDSVLAPVLGVVGVGLIIAVLVIIYLVRRNRKSPQAQNQEISSPANFQNENPQPITDGYEEPLSSQTNQNSDQDTSNPIVCISDDHQPNTDEYEESPSDAENLDIGSASGYVNVKTKITPNKNNQKYISMHGADNTRLDAEEYTEVYGNKRPDDADEYVEMKGAETTSYEELKRVKYENTKAIEDKVYTMLDDNKNKRSSRV